MENKGRTIEELVEEYGPGVKIWYYSWKPSEFFHPYYNVAGVWYGIGDNSKNESWVCVGVPRWFLWEEPKPKVKRYLWAIRQSRDSAPFQSEVFFADEEEVKGLYQGAYSITRIDYTMMEFDK